VLQRPLINNWKAREVGPKKMARVSLVESRTKSKITTAPLSIHYTLYLSVIESIIESLHIIINQLIKTMSLEDDQSLAVEMSKSKRKRMKQKKSKQRKEEEEVKRVSNPQIPQLDSLNPIDKMRGDLLNLGYDFDVVNAAMDKMWNLEMDYSDFNSVLNFIQGEELLLSTTSANSSTTSRNQDIGNDDANGDNCNGSGNHGKDIIIAVGTNGANGNHGRHDDDSIDPVNDNTTAATTATASGANTVVSKEYSVYSNSSQQKDLVEQEQPPVVLADNAVRIKKIRPKKFDLSEKLDFVANSENLNDGIIALTEWVTKAASPAEVRYGNTFYFNHTSFVIVSRTSYN